MITQDNDRYVILVLFYSHIAMAVTLQDSQARSTAASVMYQSSVRPVDMELVCLLFQVVTEGNLPAINKQLQTALVISDRNDITVLQQKRTENKDNYLQ